jgi:hypothetical protein
VNSRPEDQRDDPRRRRGLDAGAPDGVGVADVRITYETDDGALLLSRYYGIFDLGPGGYERALRNQYDPVPPLVLAPQFVTSHPNWLWLNRLQCLAVGRVTMAHLLVRFDLYAIRAGSPCPRRDCRASTRGADRRCPLVFATAHEPLDGRPDPER